MKKPLPPTDILTVLVSTAAIFFALAYGGKLLEGYRLQRHNARLAASIAALEAQQAQLKARRDYVKTPAFVEQVAREQYRWVKSGESLVVTVIRRRPVAEPTPTPALTPTARTSAVQPGSHWAEWWNLLTKGAPHR